MQHFSGVKHGNIQQSGLFSESFKISQTLKHNVFTTNWSEHKSDLFWDVHMNIKTVYKLILKNHKA